MRLEWDNSDEEAIEATIRYFSEAKFAQLNDQDAQRYNFTEFFVPDYQQNTNLTYIGDRFELDRQLLIVNNAVNAWYTVDVDIKDMEIDGDTAEVKFYETYRYARTNTPDITSAEGLSYKVELKKINGAWLISDLITNTSFDNLMRKEKLDVDSIVEGLETVIDEPVVYEPAVQQAAEAEYSAQARSTVSYNTNMFVNYAQMFALFYNPNFFDYSSQGLGDCQNFASQCVWKALGGVNTIDSINAKQQPMVDEPNSNDRDWFQLSSWNRDIYNHWASVQSFASYIESATSSDVGPYGVIRSGISSAKVGDIIQVGNSTEGGYYHSYVVVRVEGTAGSRTASDIWVCSHTNDYYNKPLSDVYNAQSNYYQTIQINGARY